MLNLIIVTSNKNKFSPSSFLKYIPSTIGDRTLAQLSHNAEPKRLYLHLYGESTLNVCFPIRGPLVGVKITTHTPNALPHPVDSFDGQPVGTSGPIPESLFSYVFSCQQE